MSELPSHEELTRAVYGDRVEEHTAEMKMWQDSLVDYARAHLATGAKPSAVMLDLLARVRRVVAPGYDMGEAFACAIVGLAMLDPKPSTPGPDAGPPPKPKTGRIAQWVVYNHRYGPDAHVFEDEGGAYAYAARIAASGVLATVICPDGARILVFKSEGQ